MAEETAEERERRRTNTLHYAIVILICINLILTFFLTLAQSRAPANSPFRAGPCTPDCDASCQYAPHPSARENFCGAQWAQRPLRAQRSGFTPDTLGACAQLHASPAEKEANTDLRVLRATGAYPAGFSLSGDPLPPLSGAQAEYTALQKIGMMERDSMQ